MSPEKDAAFSAALIDRPIIFQRRFRHVEEGDELTRIGDEFNTDRVGRGAGLGRRMQDTEGNIESLGGRIDVDLSEGLVAVSESAPS
ncbi:hypothetical protein ACFO8O_16530 [Hephaestia sp. GCM10023244]|uniref:hypothetical protein n=1 Tax=unclassified Hephaestia TaxID=2631281 RepID=UPI002076E9BB|nr:hypothetical protein [Hephaestia sp. MAHUQ-44]MCM8732563.1 hypothetical protein [Hephaestia sp. MAHUQ-44]